MKAETIIRAWKDPAFRASLTSEERAQLPELPSGKPLSELEDGALSDVVGGRGRPPCHPNTRPFTKTPCSAVDSCPTAFCAPDLSGL
jgi:mersacidin/lichenicidin family type 2 lantibiotic